MSNLLVHKLNSLIQLSSEEKQALENLPVVVRASPARTDIVREGDRPIQCAFLLEGWACRYKLLDAGRRQIMSFHTAGDFLELQSLHLHTVDNSVSALTDARVALISHENLLGLAGRYPNVGTALWRNSLVDAAIFREWLVGMGQRSARQRIAHLLCELYAKCEAVGLAQDFRCPLPITQIELADALGMSSVHVSRVLSDLRSEVVTISGKQLVINDWERLKAEGEFDPTYLHLGNQQAA